MIDQFDLVTQLTAEELNPQQRSQVLHEFAAGFGWRPSDSLWVPELGEFTTAHLAVEHGLETSAVISFFRSPWRYQDLGTAQRKRLFSLSYNNLVDWHIQVQPDQINYIYNRLEQPEVVASRRISRADHDAVYRVAFEQILGLRPNPNQPALDDALIRTISQWKRQLTAEMGDAIGGGALSSLFNALIFARAVEDQYRSAHSGQANPPTLIQRLIADPDLKFGAAITATLQGFVKDPVPRFLVDPEDLRPFDALDPRSVSALVSDFYHNRYAPYYSYDFSIISKHALSRIYESYVSIMRFSPSEQTSFLPELPSAEREKAFGSVYTPQYVARFFAKYLQRRVSPAVFQQITACDPTCGSGIFLRTLIELQGSAEIPRLTVDTATAYFARVLGTDVDQNAAHAARLSLSLLHLVFTGALPKDLKIYAAEAITFYSENGELDETYDAVLANPPFVAISSQHQDLRNQIADFMGEDASGRTDLYLAVLKVALMLLKPGGYGLFVLPHSFLIGRSAEGMRRLLTQNASIRLLADLSSIRVFEDVSTYVVLVVFQKNGPDVQRDELATIVRCQDLAGIALEDALEERYTENSYYSIYRASQQKFKEDAWVVLPPFESGLLERLRTFPNLDEFLQVRQGIVTGADSVFIRPAQNVPVEELDIYLPFLPDREMTAYRTPETFDSYVFYPYLNGEKVTAAQLAKGFPKTWAHLSRHKDALSARGSLERYGKEWWEPMWPRTPENLVRPKLISPNLVIVPRFSLDMKGDIAISRSPLLYPKRQGADTDMLLFFLGVLNSSVCHWFISSHAHAYRGGYAKVEPKTLKQTPVPHPSKIDTGRRKEFLTSVKRRIEASGTAARDIEEEIDSLVASMYGLSEDERRRLLGGGE